MTALDTNVVVRFLVRDDEKQARQVYNRFARAEEERERFFVPLCVILEIIWVLESAYGLRRANILGALEDLCRMAVLDFGNGDALDRFLTDARRHSSADLSDLLIAHTAKAADCDSCLTFDRKAARLPFFELLT